MSVVVPVSGSHTNTLNISGNYDFSQLYATFDEIDKVESLFEDFRSKINSLGLQYPKHSLFPQVRALVETMVWSE